MRDQTRKVRSVREHHVGLEAERAFERRFDVVFEIDHIEAVSAQLDRRTSSGREPDFVSSRDEAADHAAGAQRASETIARDAV